LATTDGRKLGVRPMGGLAWKQNQLLCATFASFDKVAQLRKVPYAEHCFCDSTGKHVCIAGSYSISTTSDNFEVTMPNLLKTIDGELVGFINNSQKIVIE
jgi:hypothetical protein